MKLLGIISADFDITDQLLIKYSTIVRYWRKYGNIIRQLIIDYEKVYDSVSTEVWKYSTIFLMNLVYLLN